MFSGGAPLSTTDAHDLAHRLNPALHEAAAGRLGPIEWFSSLHQRGGSATGFSTWHSGNGATAVVVKLPVSDVELRWTSALGLVDADHWDDRWALVLPTPRVMTCGVSLGGQDVAWLVTERLDERPQHAAITEDAIEDILRAAADFQAAAMKVSPLGPRDPAPDWERAVTRSRELARAGGFPESQRWNEVLKKVLRVLPLLAHRWESRPINAWCHGDLHPGNAMRRRLPREIPDPELVNRHGCVLIDLALVHSGHWIEDALYLERQFWGHEGFLGRVRPVSMLAKLRRQRGLPADDNYGELAMVRRVLMASCAPAMLEREGGLKYLHAALGVIERFLPQVVRH